MSQIFHSTKKKIPAESTCCFPFKNIQIKAYKGNVTENYNTAHCKNLLWSWQYIFEAPVLQTYDHVKLLL